MKPVFRDHSIDSQFKADGFCIVRGFLRPAEVSGLRETFNRYSFQSRAGFVSSNYSTDARFRRAIFSSLESLILPKCDTLIDGYQGVSSALLNKKAWRKSEVGLHLDWQMVDEPRYTGINVWIPLVRTNRFNGTISVLPGSHAQNEMLRGPNFKAPQHFLSKSFDRKNLKTLSFRAGDCLIFDSRLLHCSGRNQSFRNRPAISFLMAPCDAELVHYYFDTENDVVRKYRVSRDFYVESIRYRNVNGKYELSPGLPGEYEDVREDYEKRLHTSIAFFERSFC